MSDNRMVVSTQLRLEASRRRCPEPIVELAIDPTEKDLQDGGGTETYQCCLDRPRGMQEYGRVDDRPEDSHARRICYELSVGECLDVSVVLVAMLGLSVLSLGLSAPVLGRSSAARREKSGVRPPVRLGGNIKPWERSAISSERKGLPGRKPSQGL